MTSSERCDRPTSASMHVTLPLTIPVGTFSSLSDELAKPNTILRPERGRAARKDANARVCLAAGLYSFVTAKIASFVGLATSYLWISLSSAFSCLVNFIPHRLNKLQSIMASVDTALKNVHVSKHPCVRAKLSQLRSKSCDGRTTKRLIHEIANIVCCDALAASLSTKLVGKVRFRARLSKRALLTE